MCERGLKRPRDPPTRSYSGAGEKLRPFIVLPRVALIYMPLEYSVNFGGSFTIHIRLFFNFLKLYCIFRAWNV